MPSLIIDVRPGEQLTLQGGGEQRLAATVQLVKKSGQLVRLRVTAPQEVRIEKKAEPLAHVPSMAT